MGIIEQNIVIPPQNCLRFEPEILGDAEYGVAFFNSVFDHLLARTSRNRGIHLRQAWNAAKRLDAFRLRWRASADDRGGHGWTEIYNTNAGWLPREEQADQPHNDTN